MDRRISFITRSGFCIDQFDRTNFRNLFSWSITYLSDILRDLLSDLTRTLQRIFGSFLFRAESGTTA